jgi:hypothetical protein
MFPEIAAPARRDRGHCGAAATVAASCAIYEGAADRGQGATWLLRSNRNPVIGWPSFATGTLTDGVSLQTAMQ